MSTNAVESAPAAQDNVPKLRRAGVVRYDEKKCLACRECEVVCSLSHHEVCSPELSSIRVYSNDYAAGLPDIRVCKQCDFPACYMACEARWGDAAIVIDERTGARAIDPAKCRGCGACQRACPLTPERTVIASHKVNRKPVYFKCDLCKDRESGPLCVEICPGKALTFTPAEERRG